MFYYDFKRSLKILFYVFSVFEEFLPPLFEICACIYCLGKVQDFYDADNEVVMRFYDRQRARVPCKTTGPIETLFGRQTDVGQRNRMLGWTPYDSRDGTAFAGRGALDWLCPRAPTTRVRPTPLGGDAALCRITLTACALCSVAEACGSGVVHSRATCGQARVVTNSVGLTVRWYEDNLCDTWQQSTAD